MTAQKDYRLVIIQIISYSSERLATSSFPKSTKIVTFDIYVYLMLLFLLLCLCNVLCHSEVLLRIEYTCSYVKCHIIIVYCKLDTIVSPHVGHEGHLSNCGKLKCSNPYKSILIIYVKTIMPQMTHSSDIDHNY